MTTETGHSVLLTQPYTAWTLWHVSTEDHSSNSNDCCCGSLSQLMTSAMGEESVCLAAGVALSICLSAKLWRSRPILGDPPDNNSACSYECLHLFIHPYMKKIRHTSPQSWAPTPLEWHGCWPTLPNSLQLSHILGGWIMAPVLNDSPDDRWRGHMGMVVRLPLTHTCAASEKRSMYCIWMCSRFKSKMH